MLHLLIRYVAMEVLRKSDRLKALLTNKGLYIVRSGPPSLENIEFHVEYALFVDAVPIVEGENKLKKYARYIFYKQASR